MNENRRVKFTYNARVEVRFLSEILKEREWFVTTGVKAYIPDSYSEGIRLMRDESVRWQKNKIRITRLWKDIEPDFFSVVQDFPFGEIRKLYSCQLTHFGCEGQYHSPSRIIVRVHTRDDVRNCPEVIAHEILHLVFHRYFLSKKLGYEYREGMIDALFQQSGLCRIFPRYKRQPMGKIRPRLLHTILQKR